MTRFPFPPAGPFAGTTFRGTTFRRDLHRLFDEAFGPFAAALDPNAPAAMDDANSPANGHANGHPNGHPEPQWSPAVTARESASGYVFELDLPGVSPDTVEVLAADGVLTVRGNRPATELAEGEKAFFSERRQGHFARRFRLPKNADLQKVSASYALGVLTVSVARTEPAQPVRVPVTVAGTSPDQATS